MAEGSELAGRAGEALGLILASVEAMGQQVEGILTSAENMNANSEEMVKVIDVVSSVVEQNLASAQQMAASTTQVTKSMRHIPMRQSTTCHRALLQSSWPPALLAPGRPQGRPQQNTRVSRR